MRKLLATVSVVCGLGLVAVASVSDAAQMNGLDFTPLPWYIIGPGIALLLTGTIALAIESRPERAWNALPRLQTPV